MILNKSKSEKEIAALLFGVLMIFAFNSVYGQSESIQNSDSGIYENIDESDLQKIENAVQIAKRRDEIVNLKKLNGILSQEQQLDLQLLTSNLSRINSLTTIELEKIAKNKIEFKDDINEVIDISLRQELSKLSKVTKSGVVALYPLLSSETTSENLITGKLNSQSAWIILVTDKFYKIYPIDTKDLTKTIFQFRAALGNDSYDPQSLGKLIYNAIFRRTTPNLIKTLEQDVEEYLKDYQDKTIMWSVKGVLRYIPMAALHDGNNYLVEKYNNLAFATLSFLTLSAENNPEKYILGLGVSQPGNGFMPLPGVEQELYEIVRTANSPQGLLDGVIKLNQQFTKKTLLKELGVNKYSIIHIASHFSYDQINPLNSFIVVGDGRLTINELRNESGLFSFVDLIVLSACDTMISGNFPYLLQKNGAKSVIASLWQVSDVGTPELMIRFYQLQKDNPNMSKGEAFRRAQLSLIQGTEFKNRSAPRKNQRAKLVGATEQELDLPPFVYNKSRPFAHPYYWASFVMIGNWK